VELSTDSHVYGDDIANMFYRQNQNKVHVAWFTLSYKNFFDKIFGGFWLSRPLLRPNHL